MRGPSDIFAVAQKKPNIVTTAMEEISTSCHLIPDRSCTFSKAVSSKQRAVTTHTVPKLMKSVMPATFSVISVTPNRSRMSVMVLAWLRLVCWYPFSSAACMAGPV